MSKANLTSEELVALDFLIEAVRAQNAGVDAAVRTAVIARVVMAATRYTPAVVNVATNLIGVSAKADLATVKGLEELKSAMDHVSLDQLLELRRQCVSGE